MDRDTEAYFDMIVQAVERILKASDGLDAEGMNWRPIPEETSSLAILGTHIMGNLEQGILATIAGHPDYRDRDAEFAAELDSNEELWSKWRNLKTRIQAAMGSMGPDVLDRHYNHPRQGEKTGRWILLHAACHANEHVGHAELTRQLFDVRDGS